MKRSAPAWRASHFYKKAYVIHWPRMNKRIIVAIVVVLFSGPLIAVAEAAIRQNSEDTSIYEHLIGRTFDALIYFDA
jgi:hypothetical protein